MRKRILVTANPITPSLTPFVKQHMQDANNVGQLAQTAETYAKIIKVISNLDNTSDLNKWIKSMAAQLDDLVHRAASPKCAERRQQKLIYYWKLYKDRQHVKTS